MINKLSLLTFTIFLVGCMNVSTILVNPENGDSYDCQFWGVPDQAQEFHDECVESFREIGFEPLKKDQKPPKEPIESDGN